jgi:mannose-6-phosphate isomerase-like protein (cupin superfamily)
MTAPPLPEPVNLTRALASFDDIYSPRIAARMNDYDVKIAHFKGDYVWHVHDRTDEFFLVLDGQCEIALRDADGTVRSVLLQPNDVFVVPKGIEHKPYAESEVKLLLIEPRGVLNTGDEGGERTALNDVWI